MTKFNTKMTLKNSTNELSQNAKAFSVENLLTVDSTEEKILKRKLNTTLIINSKSQMNNGITTELCCNDLWEKFNRLGTEMIVTRAGRRMFPTLKVRFLGLACNATYVVYIDISLAGTTRYRYNFQRSEWFAAGPSNHHLTLNNLYVHPSSPAKGEVWMSKEISFDKIKLTNNKRPLMRDQISLQSMHKYQPRIHILEIPTGVKILNYQNLLQYIQQHAEKSETFIFEQTTFVAVTAYQNQKITNLKIQNNPFAKGFREISSARREKHEPLSNETQRDLVYSAEENLEMSIHCVELKKLLE